MNATLREWVDKAEGDFATAGREHAVVEHANHDAVCFHAQQCVEKLLKAVLIAQGVVPPRLHDLVALAALLPSSCALLPAAEDDLRLLSQAAVQFRYPGDSASAQDAADTYRACAHLRVTLRGYLGLGA